MDETIAMRALTIGVSVLIAIATMSAVMAYYNAAKQTVLNIGTGTDVAGMYTTSVRDALLKRNPTGVDVKNLLDYFYENREANISISMNLFANGSSAYLTKKINYSNINNPQNEVMKKNLNEVIKYMMPNQKFNLTHYYDDYGILIVNVTES